MEQSNHRGLVQAIQVSLCLTWFLQIQLVLQLVLFPFAEANAETIKKPQELSHQSEPCALKTHEDWLSEVTFGYQSVCLWFLQTETSMRVCRQSLPYWSSMTPAVKSQSYYLRALLIPALPSDALPMTHYRKHTRASFPWSCLKKNSAGTHQCTPEQTSI